MRSFRAVLLLATLYGCASLAHTQEPPRSPPLSGEVLKRTLEGHSMLRPELRLKRIEYFCKDGRWKDEDHRGSLFGSYDVRGDRYCVVFKRSGNEQCAQLFHLEGDRYARQYLPDGVLMEVRLTPDRYISCY
jgi:hypothetical protein